MKLYFGLILLLLIALLSACASRSENPQPTRNLTVEAGAHAIETDNAVVIRTLTAQANPLPSKFPTLDLNATATLFAQQALDTQTAEALFPTPTRRAVIATPNPVRATATVFYMVITNTPARVRVSTPTRRPATRAATVAPPASNCDPNYSDCVPANVLDVDCFGAGGDGPVFVKGPIRVIGVDHYRLDNDGDKIACDK